MKAAIPVLSMKKFDEVAFGNDVLVHRMETGLTRLQYARALGKKSEYLIQDIEMKSVASPNLSFVFNICNWMGKDINIYFTKEI